MGVFDYISNNCILFTFFQAQSADVLLPCRQCYLTFYTRRIIISMLHTDRGGGGGPILFFKWQSKKVLGAN